MPVLWRPDLFIVCQVRGGVRYAHTFGIYILLPFMMHNFELLLDLLDTLIFRFGHGSREPEVAEPYAAVMVDQDVGRLNVPMHDACRVQEVHGAEHIINEIDNMVWREWLYLVRYLVEYFSEVTFHVLHYHEQVRELEF